MTDLLVARHGETDWNLAQRFQGHTDIGLNAFGQRQAELLAARLASEPIRAVYASDLQRAYGTALATAKRHGLAVVTDAKLRERNFGVFEGLTSLQIAEQFPDMHRRWSVREPDFAIDGGESLNAVSRRVIEALDRLARQHPGETILLVTHGGALDLIYRRALGIDLQQARAWATPNAALNHLRLDGEDWRLVAWADEEHLR